MQLLDQMAAAGRLSWYVDKFADSLQIERNDRDLWDIWLHKVWDDVSFGDFKQRHIAAAMASARNEALRGNPRKVADTVAKSRDIIGLFANPIEQAKAVRLDG